MKFNGIDFDTYFKDYPDENGYFGKYGGVYITEDLKQAMEEITEAYFTICKSSKFISELRRIRKEFQGKGLSKILMEDFFNRIKNVDIKTITLEVRVSNVNAIGLYEKYGFKNISVRKKYYPDLEDAYIFQKEVNEDD